MWTNRVGRQTISVVVEFTPVATLPAKICRGAFATPRQILPRTSAETSTNPTTAQMYFFHLYNAMLHQYVWLSVYDFKNMFRSCYIGSKGSICWGLFSSGNIVTCCRRQLNHRKRSRSWKRVLLRGRASSTRRLQASPTSPPPCAREESPDIRNCSGPHPVSFSVKFATYEQHLWRMFYDTCSLRVIGKTNLGSLFGISFPGRAEARPTSEKHPKMSLASMS